MLIELVQNSKLSDAVMETGGCLQTLGSLSNAFFIVF